MKKTVLLMPGQGSAYSGMGKDLCEKYEVARNTFQEASEAINMDIKKLCFTGDNSELIKTENAQPAILTTSVAAYRVLQETTDLNVHYFAGHSLGEFSALTCAESIDFVDAVKLVRKRGELMAQAVRDTEGIMTAVGKLPAEMIEEISATVSKQGHRVGISNYNSEQQNVISGNAEAVYEVEKKLAALGASLKRLNVSAPFHSPLMQKAADGFKEVIKDYEFTSPKVPVLSNVTSKPHVLKEIKQKLVEQIVSPVRWVQCMRYLKSIEIRMAIDIGPGKILRDLMISNMRSLKSLSYDVPDERIEIEKLVLQNKPIAFVSRCMGIAVSTKNKCQDDDIFKRSVIPLYKNLQEMQEKIESEDRSATEEEKELAERILIKILTIKQVAQEEIDSRIERLYLDTSSFSGV